METIVLGVDPRNPSPEVIRRAAEALRAGLLVAFPTETVYGLGANAQDAVAVGRIFEAKGRPVTNPVIVHVADSSEVLNVAATWPATAARLAEHFWPGPLTLVLPKRDAIANIVTAGGPTVAVRCPDHAVARALIGAAGVPVAAPSANRSTELSPTRAEHVLNSLNGRIDVLLDGGPCPGGIESTVVDVTGVVPRVLRPGLVTIPMLETVCGKVEIGPSEEGVARSPGLLAKHYSPRTRLTLVASNQLLDQCLQESSRGLRVGTLRFSGSNFRQDTDTNLTADPERAAALLYDTLHRLDQAGLDLILAEFPPDTPEWAAIRDRLARAAVE